MKRLYWIILWVLGFASCKPDTQEITSPLDYKDWVAIVSPEPKAVEAVYGSIDSLLVISTGLQIYYTTNYGKTWSKSNQGHSGVRGFIAHGDSLFALTTEYQWTGNPTVYANSAQMVSLDKGVSWKVMPRPTDLFVPRNRVAAPNGTTYEIDEVRTPTRPGATSTFWVDYPGVKTSNSRHLSIPEMHQIKSIRLDSKGRLYVAASAPICERRENFAFCKDKNSVIYVSRKPLP